MVGCFGFEFILIGVKKGGVRVCVFVSRMEGVSNPRAYEERSWGDWSCCSVIHGWLRDSK